MLNLPTLAYVAYGPGVPKLQSSTVSGRFLQSLRYRYSQFPLVLRTSSAVFLAVLRPSKSRQPLLHVGGHFQ